MIYLIFYDIENDRLRKKIADKLIEYGYERLQLSVFAGPENPKGIAGLWQTLKKLVVSGKGEGDKLYALRVDRSSFKKMLRMGKGRLDISYICGEQHTVIC